MPPVNTDCLLFCDADSSAADVEQLCMKCDRCFSQGVTAFESISDVVNMALLHSNRGKLMRLQAQSIANSLLDAKKREFTNAERNFYLQVCVTVIVEYYYCCSGAATNSTTVLWAICMITSNCMVTTRQTHWMHSASTHFCKKKLFTKFDLVT